MIRIAGWFYRNKKLTAGLLLSVIFFAGFGLRIASSVARDRAISYDEVIYTAFGLHMKTHPFDYDPRVVKAYLEARYPEYKTAKFATPFYMNVPLFKHPPLYPWLLSLCLRFPFKPYPFMDAFFLSSAMAMLQVLVTFGIGKKFGGYRTGLLAALLLAADPVHWQCSVRIWMESTLALFMLLALGPFAKIMSGVKYAVWAGAVLGLALLTKYTAAILVFIFLGHALTNAPTLIYRKRFWLMGLIGAVLWAPWLLWNAWVYGAASIPTVSLMTGAARVYHDRKWLLYALLAGGILWLASHVRYYWKVRRDPDARAAGWASYASAFCVTGAFLAALFSADFRSALSHLAVPGYLPATGIHLGLFRNEAWTFYLGRLTELSPFYVIGFIALIRGALKRGRQDGLLVVSAACMTAFFIIWGNFQSRYLLPVMPLFLILAGRLLVETYDALRRLPKGAGGWAAWPVFWLLMVYCAGKTLYVTYALLFLSSPNMCYF